MLRPADLTARPDFSAGPLRVSPSRRLIEGPSGTVHVEPIVMQVFLVLLDGRGRVVTRDELFDACWGGGIVGDDSLNRAIARVRKIESEAAPGLFEIETVPRTGYRLTGEILSRLSVDQRSPEAPGEGARISRRVLIGSAAAAGIAGGAGLWWSVRSRQDREFDELLVRGEQALESADPAANAAQFLQRALAIRPDSAKAHGLFAYARAVRVENAETGIGGALEDAQSAARAALQIDPNEPNARVAQVIIERSMLDFAATEVRLRTVLATSPDNILARRQLWSLLQCVGRSRDSLATIEQALALKPLSAGNHYPRAQLLWILGRNAEADRVIDRAMQYWPSHRFVRFARFWIFAFTGRARAALAMLDEKMPSPVPAESIPVLRLSLAALDEPSPARIAAARKANLEAAKGNLRLSNQAASVLSALGEIDAAFEITDALFAVRPPEFRQEGSANRTPARSTAWRFAPWLFTPPLAPMRADPRFDAICDGIGLTDYWAKRGIKPDYQLGIA